MRHTSLLLLVATTSAQDLRAAKAADAWLRGHGPAPDAWAARAAGDLAPRWRKLSSGFYKQVLKTTFRGTEVVVKRRKLSGRAKDGSREAQRHEREVRGEIVYLE